MIDPILNPKEAPAGYYAVLKTSVVHHELGNICRACEWRTTCQKPETDFSKPNHRCMDTPVVHRLTGKVIQRADGCSVVFKRLPDPPAPAQEPELFGDLPLFAAPQP